MKWLHIVSVGLLIVGGINWGLIGLFDYNLVSMILSGYPAMVDVVYVLVGLAAVELLFTHPQDCKMCMMHGKKK